MAQMLCSLNSCVYVVLMVLCRAAKGPEASEGPLQAEGHDLFAGCKTEDLDGFLHWDRRRAAH